MLLLWVHVRTSLGVISMTDLFKFGNPMKRNDAIMTPLLNTMAKFGPPHKPNNVYIIRKVLIGAI